MRPQAPRPAPSAPPGLSPPPQVLPHATRAGPAPGDSDVLGKPADLLRGADLHPSEGLSLGPARAGLCSPTPPRRALTGLWESMGTAEWVGLARAGHAGASTAGACGLCVAGSYQTGSGSPLRRRAEELTLCAHMGAASAAWYSIVSSYCIVSSGQRALRLVRITKGRAKSFVY